jgi:hypothetical protein
MHKMTFRISSQFDGTQRVDPWFERAMESVRNALATPASVMVPAHGVRTGQTRFEARLAALSR